MPYALNDAVAVLAIYSKQFRKHRLEGHMYDLNFDNKAIYTEIKSVLESK